MPKALLSREDTRNSITGLEAFARDRMLMQGKQVPSSKLRITHLVLLGGVLVAGCQLESPTQSSTPEKESVAPSSPAASRNDAEPEVKPGMSMADVKKIKGTPKETRHDHGPNDSELDFWVYDDQTVKFQDGKVVE